MASAQNAHVTVHVLEYEAVRDRMLALEKERDQWQDRCRSVERERDRAEDALHTIRTLAKEQPTTLLGRSVLEVLARWAK